MVFDESSAEYSIYDQRFGCRKDKNGRLEFFMGGTWQLSDGLAAKWDTLSDPAPKSEVMAFIKKMQSS